MKLNEIDNEINTVQLDEISWKGVKKGAAGVALSGAIASASMNPDALKQTDTAIDYSPVQKQQNTELNYVPLTKNKNEKLLASVAQNNGIRGIELAAFMSQMAHESINFTDMVENNPNIKKYGSGRLAKILGNKNDNDAKRFVGRGFIQLTGRWNYEWMEKELGIDLTSTWSNAHRAAEPDIAAEIAVQYWKKRVQPNVNDYTDVPSVTRQINSNLNGVDDRKRKFRIIVQNMDIDI